MGICAEKFGIMSMSHRKKKKSRCLKILFNAANHHSAVRVTYLLGDHTDRIRAFYACERAKKLGR